MNERTGDGAKAICAILVSGALFTALLSLHIYFYHGVGIGDKLTVKIKTPDGKRRAPMQAMVVAVTRDGDLLIEGNRRVTDGQDVWLQTLSGIVRRDDLQSGRFIDSDNIVNFHYSKKSTADD